MNTNKYNITRSENGRKVILEMNRDERIGYELKALEEMTNEQACHLYKVDSKEQARTGIIEYWKYIA